MKFLTQINRNYLLPLFSVLFVMTIAGYFLVQVILTYDAKEKLLSNVYLVEQQIKSTGVVPNLHPIIEVQNSVSEPVINRPFKKVTLRNEWEKEDEVYLEYTSKVVVDGSWYLVKIRNPLFENEDLILMLALTLSVLMFSAFIIAYLSTKKMNRSVWAGFEHTLHEIERFSLKHGMGISLQESSIEEFERLNHVVTDFTERLHSDYRMLKEFTENASHEIQTPVSIALMNLEEILQQDIEEEVFQKVVIAIQSLKRLSALNQSLILLAKIENRQFESYADVSFGGLAQRKIEEFNAFFELKDLEVDLRLEGDFIFSMNEYLSEILIGNLISNAVHHNFDGGSIQILITPVFFRICNTGVNIALDNKTIFNRFVSGNSKSSGLGLAIVRQICEEYHLTLQYSKDNLHCFTLLPKV